jgi:hypothetical protein
VIVVGPPAAAGKRGWRGWPLAALLFLLSLATATTLGAVWTLLVSTELVTELVPALTPSTVLAVWRDPHRIALGLAFALPALLILLAHELGHWFACRHHRLVATPPYFLPAPVGLGTFGAFIRIRTPIRSRRELLDVGVSGPIAGFVALLPFLVLGVAWSRPAELAGAARFGVPVVLYQPGDSLLLAGLTRLFHGELPAGVLLEPHPFLLAAWLGLFATMLNLLPLAQLDGGHILYALAGRRHRRLAWPLWLALAALGWWWPGWWLWCAIVLILGMRHPRLVDESRPLDRRRRAWAGATLAIFVAGFMPVPIRVVEIGFETAPTAPTDSSTVAAEVDDQGHRTVVDQLDGHVGAEAAALDRHAQTLELFGQPRDQRLGLLRPSGAGERRPPAAAGVGEQRELRDQQHGAAGGGEVEVHRPLGVVEDP